MVRRSRSVRQLKGWPWDAVRALELSLGAYVIFGSAPLLAHGLVSTIGDIDLLATGAAWQKAQRLASPKAAPGGDLIVQLTPELAVFNGWLGLDADAIISRAVVWDSLPLAKLGDVAAYKRRLNRPKDRAHLKLLEPYLTKPSS